MIKNYFLKLSKKNNLKLNILGKQIYDQGSKDEESYYKKIFGKELKFIRNYPGRETYKIIRKFKYVLNIDSTLGIENFATGGRTGFIFNRPYKNIISSRAFGYLEKLGRKGLFWTSYNNEKETERVFNFIIKSKEKKWNRINKFYFNKVMPYEENNKTFNLILKNQIRIKKS